MPLDQLVGAPPTGDPRIHLSARPSGGRTVIPLTGAGGVQAWKILVPTTQNAPTLRSHEGNEWLCVLTGRLRLLLGDSDNVLVAGDVTDFDTLTPHWFGSTGEEPAEILSIFGRPGERMRHRTDVSPAAPVD